MTAVLLVILDITALSLEELLPITYLRDYKAVTKCTPTPSTILLRVMYLQNASLMNLLP